MSSAWKKPDFALIEPIKPKFNEISHVQWKLHINFKGAKLQLQKRFRKCAYEL